MTLRHYLAEREGFEPSKGFLNPYSLSRGAPSATRPPLRDRVFYTFIWDSGTTKSRMNPLLREIRGLIRSYGSDLRSPVGSPVPSARSFRIRW